MYKRNIFIFGLVGALATLSFIVGVWNGINVKPKRRPAAVGYLKVEDPVEKSLDVNYQLRNSHSRGSDHNFYFQSWTKLLSLYNTTIFDGVGFLNL